jgi:sec-independent protein translocase protein TatA
MRGLFEGWHLIILLLVIVLLFGAKRLPDAARGLGRSLRIFKSEMTQLREDEPRQQPRASEPIEGRVVENQPQQRATTPGETPRDV